MVGLNLSKMKKVASDAKTSTFQHEDGHIVKILHSALPYIHREQLKRLPIQKMAEGGTPQALMNNDDYSDTQPAEEPTVALQDLGKKISPDDVGTDDTLPALSGADQEKEYNDRMNGADPDQRDNYLLNYGKINPDQQDNSIFKGTPDQSLDKEIADNQGITKASYQSEVPAKEIPIAKTDVQKAYDLGQKSIREQQAIDTKIAQAEQPIVKSDVEARAELVDGFRRNTQDFQAHQQQFMKDYMNNHINPKSYMQSMDSGQKVATAIGLFLGGLSTPFTHQGNPAMDFLNKQIDRDIEAQQSKIGQQKTLLEANQGLYHDQVLANNATRMNLNDIYAHKIQQAAAQQGTPQAKAKADAASANFALQNNNLLQQSAIRATVLHSMAGGGQGLDAIDLAHAGLMKPEQAEKEQSSIDAQKRAHQAVDDYYDQMQKEQTAGNFLNPQSMKRVNTANAGLTTSIMEASPSKRLTRESIEQEVDPFKVKTSDAQNVIDYKRQQAHELVGKHADSTPMMAKYAPNSIPKYDILPFSPIEKAALLEAQKNPQDPKSQQVISIIKKKYGK